MWYPSNDAVNIHNFITISILLRRRSRNPGHEVTEESRSRDYLCIKQVNVLEGGRIIGKLRIWR